MAFLFERQFIYFEKVTPKNSPLERGGQPKAGGVCYEGG